MKGLVFSGVLLLITSFVLPAQAKYKSTCGSLSGTNAKYCVHKDADSQNAEVLYRLHGAIGDIGDWNSNSHFTKRIVELWNEQGFQGPTVVEFTFGQLWVLAPKNSKPASGLLETVVNDVIPRLESEVLGLTAAPSRILYGESMGGLNAAILLMKAPQMWRRGVIVCPAIASLSPYASNAEVQDYINRTGANPMLVQFSLKVARDYFANDQDWAQVDPLIAGQRELGPQTPPFHLSCGAKDEYGFFLDTEAFAGLATQKGVPVTWQPLEGGHCAVDATAVANYLTL